MICPNCGAQYEVDASVIPENGRDVQCSNCGHTWFQRSANSDPEPVEQAGSNPAETAPENAADQADLPAVEGFGPVVETDAEPEAETAEDRSEGFAEADSDAPVIAAPDTEAATAEPQRREMDQDVASILRQEAERETAKRSSENIGLETQTDLGLSDDPAEKNISVKKRMDRLRGLDEDHGASAAAAAIDAGPRKHLLPDIEELNSTLTASTDGASDEPDEVILETRRRSGFRRGFAITILFFSVLVLIYVIAPQIADAVPQLKPALITYVDWVNALRLSVDQMMQRAVEKLTLLVAQIGGDGSA